MNKGAFAAVIRDNSVLLVRSSTNPKWSDYWSFPGGVVEPNELLKTAAAREVFEETGVSCDIHELISHDNNIDGNIAVSIFRAAYVEGKIIKDDSEILDAQWFLLSDALQLPLAYNCADIIKSMSS